MITGLGASCVVLQESCAVNHARSCFWRLCSRVRASSRRRRRRRPLDRSILGQRTEVHAMRSGRSSNRASSFARQRQKAATTSRGSKSNADFLIHRVRLSQKSVAPIGFESTWFDCASLGVRDFVAPSEFCFSRAKRGQNKRARGLFPADLVGAREQSFCNDFALLLSAAIRTQIGARPPA